MITMKPTLTRNVVYFSIMVISPVLTVFQKPLIQQEKPS